MENAPFKLPYKNLPPSENVKKLQELEKQLHFLEGRVKELEMMYIAAIHVSEDDQSESLGSQDSDDSDYPFVKKHKK